MRDGKDNFTRDKIFNRCKIKLNIGKLGHLGTHKENSNSRFLMSGSI